MPGGLFELIIPLVLFVKGFSIDQRRLREDAAEHPTDRLAVALT
jgi:hypothetical protein